MEVYGMPFIHARTNQSIGKDSKAKISALLGQAIEAIPGKTEQWLMTEIEDQKGMFFAGTSEPCAMITIDLFGQSDDASCDQLTQKVTEIVAAETGIRTERIYVRYLSTDQWGWNGHNF